MIIRKADASDMPHLHHIAQAMATSHAVDYFAQCLQEQEQGKRIIFLALVDHVPIGYVQLNWKPLYAPFLRLDIPEIQDLNVIPSARQQGIGGRLIDHCENLARASGKTDVGISVGVDSRFGAAQRLYVKKGYVPDGGGLSFDDVPVRVGEMRLIGDGLTLKLVKGL